MVTETGQVALRAEAIDAAIRDLAQQEFVMKQVVTVSSSSAWRESYWRETAGELAAAGVQAIRGVPRLTNFPELTPSWTRVSAYNEKYGGTITIAWEDIVTDEIDVMARSMVKVANAIANSVDTQIWNVLTENQSASAINTIAVAAGSEWNSATIANRNPVADILNAIREISIDNINPYARQSYLLVNPTSFSDLMANSDIVKHPTWEGSKEIMSNGRAARLLGLQVLVSNVVTADYASIFVGQLCGVWKELAPLTTETVEKKGISRTINAFGAGVTQLSNPNAVCLLSNVRA